MALIILHFYFVLKKKGSLTYRILIPLSQATSLCLEQKMTLPLFFLALQYATETTFSINCHTAALITVIHKKLIIRATFDAFNFFRGSSSER